MKYDNEQLSDKSACSGVRADLKMCLLESDCCKIVSFRFPRMNAELIHSHSNLAKENPPRMS